MKIVILLTLLVSVNSYAREFRYNDKVWYKVPEFYKNVCSGQGIIVDEIKLFSGKAYEVKSPNSELSCPTKLIIDDKDLTLRK